MANQDLIFPILPRPQPRVTNEDSKVRKVSERPVIATSEKEQKNPTTEELDRVAKAMEQKDRQRKRHPQSENKKLKKLQQMQQRPDEDTPHLDITA